MAYKIDTNECLKCGVCLIQECPTGAFVEDNRVVEKDGLVLHTVHIDASLCNDCGVCQSQDYWCPAQAIVA
jgi:ferredoxin